MNDQAQEESQRFPRIKLAITQTPVSAGPDAHNFDGCLDLNIDFDWPTDPDLSIIYPFVQQHHLSDDDRASLESQEIRTGKGFPVEIHGHLWSQAIAQLTFLAHESSESDRNRHDVEDFLQTPLVSPMPYRRATIAIDQGGSSILRLGSILHIQAAEARTTLDNPLAYLDITSAPLEYARLDLLDLLLAVGHRFIGQSKAVAATSVADADDNLEKALCCFWLGANMSVSLHRHNRTTRAPQVAAISYLSSSLHSRFVINLEKNDMLLAHSDLQQTIDLTRWALEICDRPRWVTEVEGIEERRWKFACMAQLATYLVDELQHFGISDNAEELVEWCRESLVLLAPQAEEFKHWSPVKDLVLTTPDRQFPFVLADEPLLEPTSSWNTFQVMYDRAYALLTTKQHKQVEHAVSAAREAVVPAGADANEEDRVVAMHELASAIMSRYDHTGELDDLSEVIELERTAMNQFQPEHPAQQASLTVLAHALAERAEKLRAVEDIDESLRIYRVALSWYMCGDDASASLTPSLTDNMGLARLLHRRFDLAPEGEEEMINEAICLYEEELQAPTYPMLPTGSRARLLFNLATATYSKFRVFKSPDDATAAIRHLVEAVELSNGENVYADRARYLSTLAKMCLDQSSPHFDVTTGLTHLRLALWDKRTTPQKLVEYFQSTMAASRYVFSNGNSVNTKGLHFVGPGPDPHAADRMRLAYLRFLVTLMSGIDPNNQESVRLLNEVYLNAVQILPKLAYLGLDIKSRLSVLRNCSEITAVAGTLLCFANQEPRALQIIEEGRALFWSQALRLRSQFEELPEYLRQHLSEIAQTLEQEGFGVNVSQGDQLLSTSRADPRAIEERQLRLWRQSEDFNNLIERIRDLPGHERFMLPQLYESLLQVADQGPVVVLISHSYGCFAHVMSRKEPGGEITGQHLPLPGITDYQLSSMAKDLQNINDSVRGDSDSEADDASAQGSDTRGDRAARPPARKTKAPDANPLLELLWYRVVKPVIDTLGLKPSTGRDRPRLWWCPTGSLAFLPVHAAGVYSKGGPCCSDFVVSSYTPTLNTLLKARQSYQPVAVQDAKMLLAAVPRPFKGANLPGTVSELRKITAVVPSDRRIPMPPDEDAALGPRFGATVDTIIDNLPQATILHLASHGKQDHNSPLDSGFVMRDDMLTIAKLMPIPLPNAFLAFLSACETARGDEQQADQVIHLAAAMLFVGFKSVIGTMWRMNDDDGPEVAAEVYAQLFSAKEHLLDPDTVAYALDDAVQGLRRKGVSASRWAPFIHLGI